MVALRTRSLGVFSIAPFWLSAFCAALTPTAVGYQGLAARFARPPAIPGRWREHLIASPFGTIHAATFSFARPLGTDLPEPTLAQPVNFDPRSLDVKVWAVDAPPMAHPALEVEYPTVNRRLKGDRLPQSRPPASEPETLPQLQPIDAPSSPPTVRPPAPAPGSVPRPKNAEEPATAPAAAQADVETTGTISPMSAAPVEGDAAFSAAPSVAPMSTASLEHGNAADLDAEDDLGLADQPPQIPAAAENDAPASFSALSFLNEEPAERDAQIYFGVAGMGSTGGLQRWAPGAEPVLVPHAIDPDIKLSALDGRADSGTGGETVAGKDDAAQMQSPAIRLGLVGKPRARAEKCLADAVYFEARGEPSRGQMAVAQVVMNRVFSGYYPNNVCGVVYQNANRHLACQFTFACEGKDLSRIDELDMWAQAKRIAKDTLDGKIWLSEVGHATHYHAYWVHPSWVHEMKKMYKLGVHTFYRPRAWGDGSDAPIWGGVPSAPRAEAAPAAATVPSVTAPPATAAKIPQAALSPFLTLPATAGSVAKL
jgi:spore germination cell wall hydrolase CwlJ-like protein